MTHAEIDAEINAELDRKPCEACKQTHARRLLLCAAHPLSGVHAIYKSDDGTMQIECRSCHKVIVVVIVAGMPASKENIV